VWARDAASLAAMADRWGWEETVTDWRIAIDRSDVDAIDIALPNHLQAAAALAATQAGKMVLCEKPLAMKVSEARTRIDAAKASTKYALVQLPPCTDRCVRSRVDYARAAGRDFSLSHGLYAAVGATKTWRMDPDQAGSGVGDDLLTHSMDTAIYLNGPIQDITATTRTFVPDRAIDDAVSLLAHFDNGSLGSFEATHFNIGYRNSNRFEIHGSGGMLRFDLERLNQLDFYDANQPRQEQGPRDIMVTHPAHPIFSNFWRPGHVIGYERTFVATLAGFLRCVSRGEEFHPNFLDRLKVQQVLAAVQESANSRSWTEVRND
jgi:predicted dehydrogenase